LFYDAFLIGGATVVMLYAFIAGNSSNALDYAHFQYMPHAGIASIIFIIGILDKMRRVGNGTAS
jgi:hypothetical protein